MTHRRSTVRRGFTIGESVVIAVVAVVTMAVVVPVVANIASASGETRSLSNLRLLNVAHESYAATFSQRQLTFVQDDAGVYNGNCISIVVQNCPPQLLLGESPSGAMWGYYLGAGQCAQYPGTCSNWVAYKPIEFAGVNAGFGAFRLGNARAFNGFVEGRFYSDTFYAPNDALAFDRSSVYRDQVIDFNSTGGDIYNTSYCLSPAAMWHPDVLGAAFGGYRDPNTFAEGYHSPSVTQCLYPELKTRLIEHNWCYNAPSLTLPTSQSTAYPFNASAAVAPLSLFFDGHVARLRNAKAIADDEAIFQSSGQRLWSRTTPFGPGGYLESQAFDPPGTPRTSHTILTIDGILGRDVLTN